MSSKKRATPKKNKSPKTVKPKKEIKKPRKQRSVKAKKISGAPKRPKSAWIYYLSEQRPHVLKAQPSASVTDITKLVSTEWKALKPAQKAKYERMAEGDRERYRADMLNYVPSPEDKEKKRRKHKDKTGPKKAKTAFNYYVAGQSEKMRAANPGAPMSQIMRLIAASWGTISEREKEKYMKMADQDKVRFEQEKNQS